MRHKFLLTTLLCLVPLGSHLAHAATQQISALNTLSACSSDIYGPWVTHDGRGVINISDCAEDNICGHALQFSNGKNYSEITPSELPQLHTNTGQIILDEFKAKSENKFSGRIFNPDNGKSFKSIVKISDDKKSLKVKGCVGPICESFNWQRPETCG